MTRRTVPLVAWLALLALPALGSGQDSNINLPIPEVERRLETADYEIISLTPSRGLEGERTYAATLKYPDGSMMRAKWAPAPRNGGEFNNRPRLEIAAYEIQKLFLDESEYVVPPTLGRCVAMSEYPQPKSPLPPVEPTFGEWNMALVVLQFWLWNVDGDIDAKKILDKKRFKQDPTYARHVANFNLLTYLIRHRDSNKGNFLISTDPNNPRVFSVDNGISFSGGEESNRGKHWERVRVDAFPASSIERLRALTEEDVHRAMGVVAQFDMGPDGRMVPVEPTENLDPDDGIRRQGTVLQLGLKESEIRRLYDRIQKVLEDVDKGKYELF